MNRFTRFAWYRLPTLALYAALFWQSSLPGTAQEPLFPHDDKVLHFAAYSLLGFLTARWLAFDRPEWSSLAIRVTAIAACCLFGLSDEIHQSFVPGRVPSAADLAADALGSVFGTWVYLNVFLGRLKWRV